MRSTEILYPLDDDHNELDHHKEAWKFVKKYLNDMKEGQDITFDQLLVNLRLTEKNYLLAIRSSLKAPTIFLQCSMSQCMACKYGHPVCTRCIRMCNVHCIKYIQSSKRHE